ncbi:MAB_1171c family putative transporter [Streptomyces sp. NPDC052012]|uniref:MAB_1171c family putative transporter n=1 Tax=Streptomyces sp. NPDC052012 TaxID=3155051 RepID=UPI003450035F
MLSVLLGIVLCVALAWKLRQFLKDPADKLLRAVLLCIVCAALSFPFGTAGGARVVDGLAGEGTAKFLQNFALLLTVYFLQCFFIYAASHAQSGPDHARKKLVPLSTTVLVMAAAMPTPRNERDHTYATADMQVTGVAVFYLAAGLYLTYALAVALRWAVEYARASRRPLAIGLWMVVASLATMVAAAAVREAFSVSRWLGIEVPHPLIMTAKLLLDLAIPLFVLGILYPAAMTRWARLRLWWAPLAGVSALGAAVEGNAPGLS